VGFGEVLVLAGDDDDPFPEVPAAGAAVRFRAVVISEARGDVVGLADVDERLDRRFGVRADQEIHAGAGTFWALDQLAESAARAGEHVAGPVDDFGGQQASRCAVDEEQADAAALGHGSLAS